MRVCLSQFHSIDSNSLSQLLSEIYRTADETVEKSHSSLQQKPLSLIAQKSTETNPTVELTRSISCLSTFLHASLIYLTAI